MAHALYHWRHALNQTVLEWLARAGHLTPDKIVERENLRQKKREKATNKIVDGMEATGVMRELYKEFKNNLAAARDSKVFELRCAICSIEALLIWNSPHDFLIEVEIFGVGIGRWLLVGRFVSMSFGST